MQLRKCQCLAPAHFFAYRPRDSGQLIRAEADDETGENQVIAVSANDLNVNMVVEIQRSWFKIDRFYRKWANSI